MRRVVTIAAAGLCLTTLTGHASAQEASQEADVQVRRGREIADKVCWVCHVTGPDQEYSPILRAPGPDFRAIAARPGTTAASLTAFLHTAHRTEDKPYTMPNPRLSDEMIDAVAHYIISLKPRS
ncbi:MAG TPA: cytochrome c [Hyphomicrobium sp.]|nr:cytochrome c [Hyphomicrobium sp.]